MNLEKLTQKIQDQILDKSNDFDPEKAKLQWANKKYGFICFDYEGERTYVNIEQDNRTALLDWYGVKNLGLFGSCLTTSLEITMACWLVGVQPVWALSLS